MPGQEPCLSQLLADIERTHSFVVRWERHRQRETDRLGWHALIQPDRGGVASRVARKQYCTPGVSVLGSGQRQPSRQGLHGAHQPDCQSNLRDQDREEDHAEAKKSGDSLTCVYMDCKNFDSSCDVSESRTEIAALIEKVENERAEKVRKLNFGIR